MPHRRSSVAAVVALAFVTVACSAPSPTPGGSGSGGAGTTSTAASTLKPLVAPRPTDIPVDGTCEQNQICLGLLKPGVTYRTKNFEPTISFRVESAQWENLSVETGVVQLQDITHPGDVIAFFRHPRAADDNGTIPTVGDSVGDLTTWLESNSELTAAPATKTNLGGLSGMVLEARIADGVTDRGSPDCPTRVCVPFFRGSDPNAKPPWQWDRGFAGPESARIFLLTSKDGVIAVLVDAHDRSTYDSLNQAADGIFKTLKFG